MKKLITDNIRYLSKEVTVTELLWVAGLQYVILKEDSVIGFSFKFSEAFQNNYSVYLLWAAAFPILY